MCFTSYPNEFRFEINFNEDLQRCTENFEKGAKIYTLEFIERECQILTCYISSFNKLNDKMKRCKYVSSKYQLFDYFSDICQRQISEIYYQRIKIIDTIISIFNDMIMKIQVKQLEYNDQGFQKPCENKIKLFEAHIEILKTARNTITSVGI